MFGLDAFHLARAQFAFTVGFHIVFPAFSIGLASYLAVLEGLWLKTGKQVYLDVFKYWLKIFSIGFAMGVVSGLVMSYEFGTNWSAFSDRAGPVIGPIMGYEVLTAFFLEAGFLGVMLFGMTKVGPRLHFAATCLVAFGTLLSGFWIISVNSWMQTPAGYSIAPDGTFMPESWLRILFNPSVFVRYPHMMLAAFLSVAFVVGAVGAWHILGERKHGGRPNEAARTMFSMAMWMAVIVAPIQILVGDASGLEVLKYQPAKLAAMEGSWHAERRAPELLFGVPDMKDGVTRHQIAIPWLGSLILTHSLDGEVPGLDQFPPENRPNAGIIFYTFRAMVGLGMLMLLVGAVAALQRWRGRLYDTRLLLWGVIAMAPSGFAALLLGWITTEVGRQPFTVYGLMRTTESVSPIAAPGLAASFLAFIVVYAIVYTAGFIFLLRLAAQPPQVGESGPPTGIPTRTAGITPGPAGAAPASAGLADRGTTIAEPPPRTPRPPRTGPTPQPAE
ncbi:MAG: cytochrome ubiquinol oxidase subunit I [Janthinobacterium lividum]